MNQIYRVFKYFSIFHGNDNQKRFCDSKIGFKIGLKREYTFNHTLHATNWSTSQENLPSKNIGGKDWIVWMDISLY